MERPAENESAEKAPPTTDVGMDSSEEDDEAPNEYEKDGFVVGNDDAEVGEEAEEGEEGERKQGKRGKSAEDVALDEDDLALIEVRCAPIDAAAHLTWRRRRTPA